jgi:hypothetical protein
MQEGKDKREMWEVRIAERGAMKYLTLAAGANGMFA